MKIPNHCRKVINIIFIFTANDSIYVMRTFNLILILIVFFSCNKSYDSAASRLIRTEFTDYKGNIFYSEYGYDDQGRIITITNHENSGQPDVAVTINYNGTGAILLSHPDTEPLYNRTTEVHLTLDANGRMLKRIEYTQDFSKTLVVQAGGKFAKDTLLCEYDAAGLLKKTTESRYDSAWSDPISYRASKLTATSSYTNNAGNLTTFDEYAVYPVNTSSGGVISVSGGTSEYHNEFRYTKSFPNKTDFKNAAVLNEYVQYYEVFLNSNYNNMPDQVIRNTVDKDINGAVIFSGISTIDIERAYNTDGLLSSVSILSHNTPYTMINYFYAR